jgi:hypothetical protein
MVVPFTNVIENKVKQDIAKSKGETEGTKSKMKYLLYHLHDTNIANYLRFLGFWKQNGYKKHVKFASSVRLEIFKRKVEGK